MGNMKTDCGVICSYENTSNIKISASQLISSMICVNYDHNKKVWAITISFGLWKM